MPWRRLWCQRLLCALVARRVCVLLRFSVPFRAIDKCLIGRSPSTRYITIIDVPVDHLFVVVAAAATECLVPPFCWRFAPCSPLPCYRAPPLRPLRPSSRSRRRPTRTTRRRRQPRRRRQRRRHRPYRQHPSHLRRPSRRAARSSRCLVREREPALVSTGSLASAGSLMMSII